MAVSKIYGNFLNLSQRIVLVDGQIEITGTTSWTHLTGTVDITPYKYLFVLIQVHGASMQSVYIPVEALRLNIYDNRISTYWEAGNLGMFSISYNGVWSIDAKTQTYKFHYLVAGFK